MEHYTQWLVYILVLYSIGILIKVEGGGAHSSHYPGGLHEEFATMKNERVSVVAGGSHWIETSCSEMCPNPP
jgi:hypothetical protein